MFNNFTGKATPASKVNLGSKKTSVSGNESSVYAQVLKSRQARQLSKLKNSKASIIQSYYRAYKELKHIRFNSFKNVAALKRQLDKHLERRFDEKFIRDLVIDLTLSKNPNEPKLIEFLETKKDKEEIVLLVPFSEFVDYEYVLASFIKLIAKNLTTDMIKRVIKPILLKNNNYLNKKSILEIVRNGYFDIITNNIPNDKNIINYFKLVFYNLKELREEDRNMVLIKFLIALTKLEPELALQSRTILSEILNRDLLEILTENDILDTFTEKHPMIDKLIMNIVIVCNSAENEDPCPEYVKLYFGIVNKMLIKCHPGIINTSSNHNETEEEEIRFLPLQNNRSLVASLCDKKTIQNLCILIHEKDSNCIAIVSTYIVLLSLLFGESKVQLSAFAYKLIVQNKNDSFSNVLTIFYEFMVNQNIMDSLRTLESLEGIPYNEDKKAFLLVYIAFCILLNNHYSIIEDDYFIKANQNAFGTSNLLNFLEHTKTIIQNLLKYESKSTYFFNMNFSRFIIETITKTYDLNLKFSFMPQNFWCIDISNTTLQEICLEFIGESKQKSNYSENYTNLVKKLPFFLSFEKRIILFRDLVEMDKKKYGYSMHFFRKDVIIRRTNIFEDGYERLNTNGELLKQALRIIFINEHGLQESGVDGGGVFKEFLNKLLNQAFDPDYGLFVINDHQKVYPLPGDFSTQKQHLDYYTFLGRLMGKALYEDILMDVAFADFFMSKMLGNPASLDQMETLDSGLYSGLIKLKHYNGNVENDFGLNFQIDIENYGDIKSIELVSNGANIPVTNANKLEYIYLVANYHLNYKLNKQCSAMLKGLHEIIPRSWLRLFNKKELQTMMSGSDKEIDIQEFKDHVVYSNGYDITHKTILIFWRFVESLRPENLKKLLRFITSCSNIPLIGFRYFSPNICIQNAGLSQERLPTSSTCLNLLKLPQYEDYETLKSKLMYCIESNCGFELT